METASAWVLTGDLPSPRIGLRGANIDNKVLMTGNWYLFEYVTLSPIMINLNDLLGIYIMNI